MTFTWTNTHSDGTSTEVEKCLGTGCTNFVAVSSSPLAAGALSHTETGLAETSVYRFRVRSSNANGSSSYLTSGDITTSLNAPTGFTAGAISDTSLAFSWTDNSSAELIYEVEKCSGTGCAVFTAVSTSPRPVNTSTFTLTGLNEATIYRVRVRAVNSIASSAWLTSGDLTTNATTVSSPTGLVVGTKTSTSLQISWTDNATNETNYEIEKCVGASCSSYVAVSASPLASNVVTFTESGLTASTTYRFRVRAISASNQSSYLSSNDITTPPTAPTVLTVGTITSSSVQFSWTNNHSDGLLNEIEKCSGTGCTDFTAASLSPVGGASTSYTESGLSENTVYRFRVRATNSNGSSNYLTSTDVSTLMKAPTVLAVSSITDTTLTLSWTDNSSVETSYEVEKCSATGCAVFVAIAGSSFASNTTSVNITGLTADTIYRFQVRAVGVGQNSTYLTSGDTGTAPAAPTGFVTGAVSYNSVAFTWTDAATTETAYQVERCSGAACTGFAALAASPLAANAVSFTDSTVAGSTVYRFRVRAVNANGNSNFLTSGDITTSVAPTPALACSSPNNAIIDYGQKGNAAGVARGIWSDTKYIPASNVGGIITLSGKVGVAYADVGAQAIKYTFWNGSYFQTETVAGDAVANVTYLRLAYLSTGADLGKPLIFWTNGAANNGQIMMASRSTASLTVAGTWTVSSIDSTGGVTNRAMEVAVSPIDQVALAYQTGTGNFIRFIYCSSSCSSGANYIPMSAGNVATAAASQLKVGLAWCQTSAGIYNPAVTYGGTANANYSICKPGTNTLTTCATNAGWTSVIFTGTPATVVATDLYIDPQIVGDVPKAIAKDATNVKTYMMGATACGAAPVALTAGAATLLGSNVASTANSFYKILKHPDYLTPANERFYLIINDALTDVKWFGTSSNAFNTAVWNLNTAGSISGTVTLGTVGATNAGADLNPVTGQIITSYGTAAATFNIFLGIIGNYLSPGVPNSATNIYYNIPVESTGHMQLNAAQVNNLAMAVTSNNRPATAYVDFSSGAAATGKLKYAIRSSSTFANSIWEISPVPGVVAVPGPQYPSLAFDNNNLPWIGYWDVTAARFILATNSQTDGMGVWTSYFFPNAGGGHGAPTPGTNHTAVAMSYSGGVAYPVMIIMDNGTTKQIKSAKLNPSTGVWSNLTQIVALSAQGGAFLTADFATTSNTIVISYQDLTTGSMRVKYSYTGDAGSTAWLTPVNVSSISANAGNGAGATIKLNPVSGSPAIAYYDQANSRLFYSTCATAPGSCTAWSGTVTSVLNGIGIGGLATTNLALLNAALTFSAAGNAYINYNSGVLDIGGIRMIDNVGGSMPSGLPTTTISGVNGALANASATNGGVPWAPQAVRFPNGVLGITYQGMGNGISIMTCGD